jgi:hypothetical protein
VKEASERGDDLESRSKSSEAVHISVSATCTQVCMIPITRSCSVPAQPGDDPADLPDMHEEPALSANHVRQSHLINLAQPRRKDALVFKLPLKAKPDATRY